MMRTPFSSALNATDCRMKALQVVGFGLDVLWGGPAGLGGGRRKNQLADEVEIGWGEIANANLIDLEVAAALFSFGGSSSTSFARDRIITVPGESGSALTAAGPDALAESNGAGGISRA
jgi:hypothetical protein